MHEVVVSVYSADRIDQKVPVGYAKKMWRFAIWKSLPGFPATRWMHFCDTLNWILPEKDELIPFSLQCRANENEIGQLLEQTRTMASPIGLMRFRIPCRFSKP
jgi:hypothetical protein